MADHPDTADLLPRPTARKPVPAWAQLPLPSRLLGIGFAAGVSIVFVVGCVAVAARLLAWGF